MSTFDERLLLEMSLMGPGAPDIEMSATELSRNVEMAFNRLDTNGDGVLTRWPEKIAVLMLTNAISLLLSSLYSLTNLRLLFFELLNIYNFSLTFSL